LLRELHILNLAVIAEARVEFTAGLNCFTGATGAGKSFVIGAVNVLLGLKGAADLLRKGADEGHVTGVFELPATVLGRVREAVDLPLPDAADDGLIVTRRLFASGRTRVSVNGTPITLAQLRSVGELLVDVHGQHDSAYLLKPANQLEVLDGFADLDADREAYRRAFDELQQARRRLSELEAGRKVREQTLELYEFQAKELEAAALDPAEFESLQGRAGVLENLEQLKTDSADAHAELYDAEGAIVDRLKAMVRTLEDLAALDAGVLPIVENVRNGSILLEEAARDLGRYIDKLDLDPAELAEVNERLTVIHRVLHKYGGTMESALETQRTLTTQIKTLRNQGEDFGDLRDRLGPLEQTVMKLADKLHAKRASAAKKLGPTIDTQLAELGMEKATFRVEVAPLAEPGPSGQDAVEFVAQLNPGLDAQPLRRIASGGELSRIMLAIKQVLAKADRVSVLVFDEIDANVGGRLADVVGGKLRALSRLHQVLCITHLPQIASYADRHLVVEKHQADDTRTTVRQLAGDDRLEELAGMIGGKSITKTTRAQAQELLDHAVDTPRAKPTPRKRRRAG
jgi:DNA repair protein RecN (Recombination protein N)